MDDRAAHRGSVNLDSVNVDAQAMRPRAEDESHGGSAAFLERRFKLGAALGQGGMGTVQQGVDRRLLRSVAVKVIHRHLNWGRNQKRFAREAQVIAQLEHPHIVPVYSFEESETGATAIVMRMIDGRTLHTFLRACRDACERGEDERPPYDLSTRLEYLIKACDAIQYAHDRGVIHRDLKPANVMLGEHKEVYVVDWGLAAVRGEAAKYMSEAMRRPTEELAEEAAPLTRHGDVFGTPQYMSPEQARGDTERIGSASDQYALGVMLFEAVYLKQARNRHPSALAAAAEGQMEPPTHVTGRHVPRDHAHHWRAPYLSVTSGVLQLPCTRGVFDARGGFVGVVGMDVAVHDLRDRLQIQGEPAWRESWLLDGRGRVLVDSRGSQTHPVGDLQDRGVELVPFSEREVFEQLREGKVGGEVEKDDQIFAYQRLRTLGWTLVASFDRAQLMQK